MFALVCEFSSNCYTYSRHGVTGIFLKALDGQCYRARKYPLVASCGDVRFVMSSEVEESLDILITLQSELSRDVSTSLDMTS